MFLGNGTHMKAPGVQKGGFPSGSVVKNPPAMQETGVRPLGRDEPLEKGMATHSSCSCLGNAMDIGAQRAIVHGVTNSQTRLGTHSLRAKGASGRKPELS